MFGKENDDSSQGSKMQPANWDVTAKCALNVHSYITIRLILVHKACWEQGWSANFTTDMHVGYKKSFVLKELLYFFMRAFIKQ